MGIGTTTPTKAKLEVVGSQDHLIAGGFGYLTATGVTGFNNSPVIGPYSIYASSRIAADGFNSHSDARIKNILGTSDSQYDLSTLMKIEITDYQMRDSIAKGKTLIKKVIAQQVAEVYPQAVTNNLTEVVPDIYQRANIEDGWILLATDLKAGERVKVITEESNSIYEVVEVTANRFKVNSFSNHSGGPSLHSGQAFVYGREVNDFHTVDYEALSTLNISATQEQQKIINAQREEIEALKRELGVQKSQNIYLTEEVNKIKEFLEGHFHQTQSKH